MSSRPRATRKKRSAALQVVLATLSTVGLLVLFIVSIAGGVLLHLDTARARRVVASEASKILDGALPGNVVIERIGHLGLDGITGIRVRIFDPENVQVVFAEGLGVEVRGFAALKTLVREGRLDLDVDRARIFHADVNLDGNPKGELRLGTAFTKDEPATPDAPGSTPFVYDIRVASLEIDHAWAHGAVPDAIVVDAEIHRLSARGHVDPRAVTADLERAGVLARALPKKLDPRGQVTGEIVIPIADDAAAGALRLDASFEGVVAEMPARIETAMNGAHVEARLFARSETGEPVRALTFEGMAPEGEVTLRAEAHGDLPRLEARASATFAGTGRLEATAKIALGPVTRVDATASFRHVDLSKLLSRGGAVGGERGRGPKSDLGADAFGHVEVGGETTKVTAHLATVASTLAGEPLPPVFVEAELDGARGNGRVRVGGDVAPSEISLALFEESGQPVVEADAHVRANDLGRLPLAPKHLHGKVDLRVRGRLAPEAGVLAARFGARAEHVGLAEDEARDVTLTGTLGGTLAAPMASFGAHAEGVRAGGIEVPSADVRAQVALDEAHGVARITVTDPHVDIVREGIFASVHADRVVATGGDVSVEGASVEGLGRPIRGSFDRTKGKMAASVEASAVDLDRVGRIAGMSELVRGGKASLTGSFDVGPGGARVNVRAKVEDARLYDIEGANVVLDADLDEAHANVDLRASLGKAGTLVVRAMNVVPKGDPIASSSWVTATGDVDVTSEVDLEKILAYLPAAVVGEREARGIVTLNGHFTRARGDAYPDVRAHLKTRGFAYGETPTTPVVSGTDIEVDIVLDAATERQGLEDVEVALRLLDAKSALVSVGVKASLPMAAILADPSAALALASRAPMRAKVSVPRRDLATLPRALGLAGAAGEVELDIEASGTLAEPELDLIAKGSDLVVPGYLKDVGAQAELRARYEARRTDLAFAFGAGTRRVLSARSQIDFDLAALATGADPVQPWKASARVDLERFPLDAVVPITDRRARGFATGTVELTNLHEDAQLRGQIALEKLEVGRAGYEVAKVAVAAGKGAGVVSARFEHGKEWLDLGASTGLSWGSALVPKLEEARPLDVRLAAHQFSLAVLQPFLTGAVHGVEGTLDGRAKVSFDGKDMTLEGGLSLSKGKVQVAALGEEFRDIRAKVTLNPDGTIAVDDAYARGSSGEVRADAKVRLKGMQLVTASAGLRIAKKDKLGLALQGTPLGEVWGQAKLEAKREGGALVATVEVPTFGIDLAESSKSTVRELDKNADVDVGLYRSRGKFVELPLDVFDLAPILPASRAAGDRTIVQVNLRNVEVLRGNMVRVVLEGSPRIEIGGATPRITGEIHTKTGAIDVQGKKFEVEQASIVFTGQADNPTVTATAAWTAVDGTRVYADFVGPVKTGKVNLRSEPGLPKNEILSLIVFGTSDAAIASAKPRGSSSSSTAATALGGFAAQGLTDALDDLTGVRAQARIDTTRANNPRPEIEVQVARTVSVAVSHVLGTPPISEPDKNLARVQWRFRRNWSLETTFGDRGRAMVDGIWQRRY